MWVRRGHLSRRALRFSNCLAFFALILACSASASRLLLFSSASCALFIFFFLPSCVPPPLR